MFLRPTRLCHCHRVVYHSLRPRAASILSVARSATHRPDKSARPLKAYSRSCVPQTSVTCPTLPHSRVAHLPSALDELLVPRRCVVGPFADSTRGLAARPPRRYPLHPNTPESPVLAAWQLWWRRRCARRTRSGCRRGTICHGRESETREEGGAGKRVV